MAVGVIVGGVAYVTSRQALPTLSQARAAQPSSAAVPVAAVVPGAATTSRGSRGNAAKPAVPADFPSQVPLPAGSVYGASGASPSWSVVKLVGGSYKDAMAGLRPLFRAAGFIDLSPRDQVPSGFQSPAYLVHVVGTSHDHSDASTEVTVQVVKR